MGKEGYEIVKEFFKEFKTSPEFLNEVEKYKKEGENLSNDEEGDKGKEALKSLCSSYLNSKDKLSKAIQWCVLRIQDKKLPSGSWITISSANANQNEWETAFTRVKEDMIRKGISGVTSNMQPANGHSHIKNWCLNNKKLPISNENKEILNNAVSFLVR